MPKLSPEIIQFFQAQGFVIVSTIDSQGRPHSSCKGIIRISKSGRVYLLDVYTKNTYDNLKNNPNISITAVDEHKFIGYCLKGKARIISDKEIGPQIKKAWDEKIASRVTQRLLKNLKEEKGHPRHPEILLPKPAYLIIMDVEEMVDLTPQHLKGKENG
jgi:uncharacterized pyridoxamine 5'-phosphate oxidase family protein